MKVIVLGAGVIGTTTAYYLARAGADVTVIDRQPCVANETSFANAGQVSPGYSTPWAAPGIPLKAIKWMFQRHAPLAISLDGSLWQLKWMASMLRECNAARYEINKERMTRVAEYSRDCLRTLRADTGIEYEQRTGGTLQLFRTQAQIDAVQRDIKVLEECGVPYELLGRDQLTSVEPGLAHARELLAGGLRLPNDETGDCQMFTTQLALKAKELGVKFRFDTSVEQIIFEGNRITGVKVGHEILKADKYVMAFANFARDLLKPLSINLPVYPVKGYSLTIPLVDESKAPQSTVLDETYKVAVTRFNNRIRVGGMAELSGFNMDLKQRRRETLEKVVTDLFPGGDLSRATFWTGLRPMTPDSTPVVGHTHFQNLFINAGHGTLGWTMACGSGKLIADLMTGHETEISTDGLDISRYQSHSNTHNSAGRPNIIHA